MLLLAKRVGLSILLIPDHLPPSVSAGYELALMPSQQQVTHFPAHQGQSRYPFDPLGEHKRTTVGPNEGD
jgi:hypothetical protein